MDEELSRGNFSAALTLVKQLQWNHAGGLRGFGAAKHAPSVSFQSLMEDESYGSLNEEDHFMCMQHKAGHFLVGYLLGVLPKGYKEPSIEALRQNEFTVGSVQSIGYEFLKELAIGRRLRRDIGQVGGRTLNHFSFAILGGLDAKCTWYLDTQKGNYTDIDKFTMGKVFGWLDYKSAADSQVRWRALTSVLILRHHVEARSRLAEAMNDSREIGWLLYGFSRECLRMVTKFRF